MTKNIKSPKNSIINQPANYYNCTYDVANLGKSECSQKITMNSQEIYIKLHENDSWASISIDKNTKSVSNNRIKSTFVIFDKKGIGNAVEIWIFPDQIENKTMNFNIKWNELINENGQFIQDGNISLHIYTVKVENPKTEAKPKISFHTEMLSSTPKSQWGIRHINTSTKGIKLPQPPNASADPINSTAEENGKETGKSSDKSWGKNDSNSWKSPIKNQQHSNAGWSSTQKIEPKKSWSTKKPDTKHKDEQNVAHTEPKAFASQAWKEILSPPKKAAPLVKENTTANIPYAGLVNQGATCYLNSALQALFHTNSFRALVYRMPTTGSEDQNTSIPLNLQRLFYMMQTSSHPCSTDSLTWSFGWRTEDIGMQHDIQEFFRVIIDNLEEKLKKLKLDSVIKALFSGTIRQYVRCVDVPCESSRIDPFYDLQLDVEGCDSLEESLKKCFKPEKLEGDNQYDAEGYGKQDAFMGNEIMSLPSVLTLHLKRFLYDVKTGGMRKVDDAFSFPESIDLDNYLAADADRSKETVYDLYSILVHSGSGYGGHYYAFIQKDGNWYKFNDTQVTLVNKDAAITDNFGGRRSIYSTDRHYSAYLLMYVRRDEAEEVMRPIAESEIPQHVKEYAERIGDAAPLVVLTNVKDDRIKLIVLSHEDIACAANEGRVELAPKHPDIVMVPRHINNAEVIEILKYMTGLDDVYVYKQDYNKKFLLLDGKVQSAPFSAYTNVFTLLVDSNTPLKDIYRIYARVFVPSSGRIKYLGEISFKEDILIKDIFPEINSRLGIPEDTSLEAYLDPSSPSSEPKKLRECSSIRQLFVSGCVVTFQVPSDMIISLPEEDEKKVHKTKFIHTYDDFINHLRTEKGIPLPEKEEPEDKADDKDLKKEDKLIIDLRPKTFTKYPDYWLFSQTWKYVKIYNQDQKFYLTVIALPTTLYSDVREAIVENTGIDFDVNKDTLQLYRPSSKSNIVTINETDFRTQLLSPPSTYGLHQHRLIFQLFKNITPQQFANSARFSIFISEDGYTISQSHKIYADRNETVANLWDKLPHEEGAMPEVVFSMLYGVIRSQLSLQDHAPIHQDIVFYMKAPEMDEKGKTILLSIEGESEQSSPTMMTYVLPEDKPEDLRERVKRLTGIDISGGCFVLSTTSGVNKFPTEKTLLYQIASERSIFIWKKQGELRSSPRRLGRQVKIYN